VTHVARLVVEWELVPFFKERKQKEEPLADLGVFASR
jgi:hypothetical protein